jgi:hypothetical protein
LSLANELGLFAAEKLESSVGPYIALASYKRLFDGPPELVTKALRGALRCAVALDDGAEVEALSVSWRARGGRGRGVSDLVRTLSSRPSKAPALSLAEADFARHPTAKAAYAVAAVRDLSGPRGDAVEAWSRAARVALETEVASLAALSVARLVASVVAGAREGSVDIPRATLASLAEKVDATLVDPRAKLFVLRARLLSTSRFKRASALSDLEILARPASGDIAEAAIAIGALHFDQNGDGIDPIELDRIVALLKHAESLGAAGVLSELERERAARMSAISTGEVELTDEDHDQLEKRIAKIGPEHPATRREWITARLLIRTKAQRSIEIGARFADAALRRTFGRPPYPWAELARDMAASGALEEATRVFDESARVSSGKPDPFTASARRALAYRALEAGDEQRAVALLQEARDLFAGAKS